MKIFFSLLALATKILDLLEKFIKFLEEEMQKRNDKKNKEFINDAFKESNKKKAAAALNDIFRK